MNFIADLPNELLGEIIHKLKPKYYARLAQTCRKINNRIWSHYKNLFVSQTKFEKHFKVDIRRLINLESLSIPDITILLVDSQLVQLSRLTCLYLDYDQNEDQAAVVRQLTQLQHLGITASSSATSLVTNLSDLISDAHSRLTSLEWSSKDFLPNLFQLPVTSCLKGLSLRLNNTTIDQTVIQSLFDMTNLRELILDGVRVKSEEQQISGFSRLIHLKDADLSDVVTEKGNRCVDFSEFQAMKALTRLNVMNQRLIEEDFRNIGKLTAIEWLEIMEYEGPVYMAYLSSLMNLKRLWQFNDTSQQIQDGLQYKYLSKLEYLVAPATEHVAQLQHLSRLTNLSIAKGDLTAEETNNLRPLTQLRELDLSCIIHEGHVDLSPLINVTSVTVYLPYACKEDLAYQQRFFGILAQLTNLRELYLSSSLHADAFQTLAQFTQLTKLRFYHNKSTFEHKHWNMAELPFKVKFSKELTD